MIAILRHTFHLAAPFWRDAPGRHLYWLLALVLVVLVAASTALNVELNQMQKAFYDALQTLNAPAFNRSITLFFIAVAGLVAVMTLLGYLEQALEIRWRRNLTDSMMQRWLSDDTFYRMERDGLCDNPDQRLSQDISEYVKLMIQSRAGLHRQSGHAGVDGLDAVAKRRPMSFNVGGTVLTIPGYLFWLAIFWGVLQTLATHVAGHQPGRPDGGAADRRGGLPLRAGQGARRGRADRAVPRQGCRAGPPDRRCSLKIRRNWSTADAAQRVPEHSPAASFSRPWRSWCRIVADGAAKCWPANSRSAR
jgi:hypothetical protein